MTTFLEESAARLAAMRATDRRRALARMEKGLALDSYDRELVYDSRASAAAQLAQTPLVGAVDLSRAAAPAGAALSEGEVRAIIRPVAERFAALQKRVETLEKTTLNTADDAEALADVVADCIKMAIDPLKEKIAALEQEIRRG